MQKIYKGLVIVFPVKIGRMHQPKLNIVFICWIDSMINIVYFSDSGPLRPILFC